MVELEGELALARQRAEELGEELGAELAVHGEDLAEAAHDGPVRWSMLAADDVPAHRAAFRVVPLKRFTDEQTQQGFSGLQFWKKFIT